MDPGCGGFEQFPPHERNFSIDRRQCICRNLESFTFWFISCTRESQRRPLNHSPKNSLQQQCVRLSRSTLASAVCSAATPAGSSTASCVLALSNPSRAILARRRVGPPHVRAQPPPSWGLARSTRLPRARASRHPLAIPFHTTISQPPQPTRLRVPASFPSCLLVSHLARSRAAPSTGARHPARRPDALGQDDWRRR